MRLGLILIIFLSALMPQAGEVCTKDSQLPYCRLIRCVKGTQWNTEKVADPFILLEGDEDYSYQMLIAPMGHNAKKFEFHTFTSDSVKTYQFDESLKVGSKCDLKGNFAKLPVNKRCKSWVPFGLGCYFKKKTELFVQPHKTQYWDGKRVYFICDKWSEYKKAQLKLKETQREHQELAKIITPLLKARMKQLARAVKGGKKNIDYKKVTAAIKRGDTSAELGDCRFFLDGNTLNLLQEALDKVFLEPKEKN